MVVSSLSEAEAKPAGASKILARNLRIYGLGGVVAPFIGIWLIDLIRQLGIEKFALNIDPTPPAPEAPDQASTESL